MFSEAVLDTILQHAEGQLFLSPEERYARLVQEHPEVIRNVPLYHIASYLGIEGPSLSRIRKRLQQASGSGLKATER